MEGPEIMSAPELMRGQQWEVGRVKWRGAVAVEEELSLHSMRLVKDFFGEFFAAMHNGTVTDCIGKWACDDVVTCTERLVFPIQVVGKEMMIKAYNEVLERSWGIDSNITFRVDECIPETPTRIRTDFTMSVHRSGMQQPIIKKRRWVLGLRGNKLASIKVSPTCQDIQCAGPFVEIPMASVPAYITPVAPPVPKAPSRSKDRPCVCNQWDSIRVKRGLALLRCRTCQSQWKLPSPDVVRCDAFLSPESCSKGHECTQLHIFPRKLPKKEQV
eukprot:TRINITY_DN92_c3_g1_i1.p1 TRINITY_DN92_c3_g1~~TRINITY_DN92_c3_g1_i1.p1  ORF type:complete len:293 (+),score=44.38 TRINITY_DN92_c3_g1_i1:66-881(+)